jgi:hypothetical protein
MKDSRIVNRVVNRFRGAALATTIAAAAALPALAPAEAVPGYDGIWSVVIVTKTGICDTSYRYPIRISKGNVENAGNATVTISGRVAKNGTLVVNVSAGDQTATGTGKLNGKTGSGSWSGGNGACAGVWQAERRG